MIPTCIIHNHPSGGLIPSVEDIYTIYKADSASLLAANASFLIQTERGTLSIEVENSSVFRSFASEVLRYPETRNQFKEDFNKFILGKPSEAELLTDTIRDKAVKYYTQVGLKFAYTNSNGNSADWAYLKIENSAIIVKNCLN